MHLLKETCSQQAAEIADLKAHLASAVDKAASTQQALQTIYTEQQGLEVLQALAGSAQCCSQCAENTGVQWRPAATCCSICLQPSRPVATGQYAPAAHGP